MSLGTLSAVFNHRRAEAATKLVLIALAEAHHGLDAPGSCALEKLRRFACLPDFDAVRESIGTLVSLGELGVSYLGNEAVEFEIHAGCPPLCDGSMHMTPRRTPESGVAG
jgi:hypothetical protein